MRTYALAPRGGRHGPAVAHSAVGKRCFLELRTTPSVTAVLRIPCTGYSSCRPVTHCFPP